MKELRSMRRNTDYNRKGKQDGSVHDELKRSFNDILKNSAAADQHLQPIEENFAQLSAKHSNKGEESATTIISAQRGDDLLEQTARTENGSKNKQKQLIMDIKSPKKEL